MTPEQPQHVDPLPETATQQGVVRDWSQIPDIETHLQGELGSWEERYIVEDFLPRGQIGMMFAAPETGKTMLLLDAVLCSLGGANLMAQMRTAQLDSIMWLDQDMGQTKFDQRISSMMRGRDTDYTALSPLCTVHEQGIMLDTDQGRHLFEELVAEYQPRFIVIDAFSDFLTESPSKQEPVTKALSTIKEVTRTFVDHQCTVLIIAHTRKNDNEYYGSEKNLSGIDFAWLAEKKSVGAADATDKVSVTQRKDRQKALIQGFEYEIVGGDQLADGSYDPVRCELIRFKQDTFDEVTGSRVLSVLMYATEMEEEGEDITVAGYVEATEGTRQYSARTARRAWQLAVDSGLLTRVSIIEHGTHVFEVTDTGYTWYQQEIQDLERAGQAPDPLVVTVDPEDADQDDADQDAEGPDSGPNTQLDIEPEDDDDQPNQGLPEAPRNTPRSPDDVGIRMRENLTGQLEPVRRPPLEPEPWQVHDPPTCTNCHRVGHVAERCHRPPRPRPEDQADPLDLLDPEEENTEPEPDEGPSPS